MSPAAILVAILGVIALLAIRLARSYYFGCPPELRHLPVVSTYRFIKSALAGEPQAVRAQLLASVTNEDGLARFWMVGRWIVIITNPHLTRKVLGDIETFTKLEVEEQTSSKILLKLLGNSLSSTNGNDWKRHRKVIAPAFHNFQTYTDVFAESAKELSEIINETLRKKPSSSLDVSDLFQRMTFDIICKAGFHYSMGSLSGKNSDFLSAYRRFIQGMLEQIPLISPLLEKLNYRGRRTEMVDSATKLDEKLYEVIEQRRAQIDVSNKQQKDKAGRPPNDLLALMIRACDADNTLTPEEMKSDLLVFFIAGHETTASALACVLYYFSAYPAVQDMARAECDSVMAGKPKEATPTYEEQRRLTYLDCVLKECLRLNPPLATLGVRRCAAAEGAYLGSQHIPQGAFLMPNVYSLHYDKRSWGENASEFDPSRFAGQGDDGGDVPEKINSNGPEPGSNSQTAELRRISWLAFGGGNRVCAGKNFSLIEQRIILAHLLRQYRLSLPPDSKHRNGLVHKGGFLVAPDTVTINFERI